MTLNMTKFKPSVNIKLDLGSEWIQNRYIPTPTHFETLSGLLEGFLGFGNNAHILVGSYGSGKSMIGTLIANLVSKNVENQELENLIQKFEKVNVEENSVIELLQKVNQLDKKFIPVVINGKQGKFKEAVLSSIHKSLKQFDLDFSLPSVAEEIKHKIALWKSEFEETYNKFCQILSDKNWDIQKYIDDVDNYDYEAIDIFKENYPNLTAGAEFSLSYSNANINEQLSYILEQLNKRNYSIFLIYDEFGRLLQGMDMSETVETMQDLQDIAELSERSNLNVLLITHKNLKQYFLSYNEELQNEFQRIQGRFRIYHTFSDPATFIRISSQVTQKYRKDWDNQINFDSEIIKYDLFPELNGKEKKSIVVDNSYPLHPVTMFTLPRLANIVAQNERTLFTFLESNENGGLKKHYEINGTWYYVYNLFDYFEPSFQEFTSDSSTGDTYYKYLRVQKKVGNTLSANDEIKLLKLLTLWDIASLNNKQKLDKEFMCFALNWELNKLNKIIKVLEDKKLIRYSLFNNAWEIFEGSSIDVNKKIQEVKQEGIKKQEKLELLSSNLENRFAYPKKYNDEKNMIRYATIYPIYASDLLSRNDEGTITSIDSDMIIFYVIPDIEIVEIKEKILELTQVDNKNLYVLPHQKLNNLDEYLTKLAWINKLLEDKYFLNEDAIVEEELLKIKENTLFTIKEIIKPFTQFKKSHWYYLGEDLKVKSDLSLSDRLSTIMWKVFNETPVINNESFNRRNISKQQLKAAKEVVNALINDTVEELKGPSKLIYASVVKNNKINDLEEKNEIRALRKKIMDQIKLGAGEFTTLLDVFKKPPFGIREPNIPILLTSILKNEWKYIMFYHKDGSYINEVDGDILYERMLDKPDNYSITYQSFDNKYKSVISIIDECFSSYLDENDMSYHPAVRINRMLSRWFRSLPKITQKTNKLSDKSVLFKQIIKRGQFEPDIALTKLYELNLDLNTLELIKSENEKYSKNHQNLIEKTIYNLSNVNSFNQLFEFVQNKNEVLKVDNKFYKVLLLSSDKNWIDNLALEIVGVKREEWSDATDEVFFKTINSLVESDDNLIELKQDYYEVKVENNSLAIPRVDLSPKGETIYTNIKDDLELMARKLPKDEIKALLFKLLVDYYEENK
ncbi:hypothetical protein UACE39S_02876 [Ureibacillus acetophenoni]